METNELEKLAVAAVNSNKGTETEASKPEEAPSAPKVCKFPDCGKHVIARGLCVSHYRQFLRSMPLKKLRPFRGLVRLPMVIRVEKKTMAALKKRVAEGRAASMYDSTRQALEVGVMLLEVLDQEKKDKKGG